MAERWVDVFVTKAADDPRTRDTSGTAAGTAYNYDDEFCCPVQTVEFHPDNFECYISESDSEWILPLWLDYGTSDWKSSKYSDIEVGDLVRIGGIHTDGFTDYLTVIEKKTVTEIHNGCSTAVKVTSSTGNQVVGTDILPAPTASSTPTGTGKISIEQNGIAHIALRLNASVNCTKLDSKVKSSLTSTYAYHRQGVSSAGFVNLATRDYARTYLTNPQRTAYGTFGDRYYFGEQYYYPLYKAKKWTSGTTLTAKLDHGVKTVAAIKLIGYSLVNKRAVGVQHAHEMQSDDYLIMRIKEIDGHVISNNQYANGSFAVLATGDTSNNVVGATEYSRYEPQGLVCMPINASNNTIRNLNIEIIDRLGRPAHFGRLHIWFKLLVTHG